MTKLVGIDGSAVDVEIPVVNVGLLLGRSSPDTPQLRTDYLLSQQHAQIGWSADGGLMIRDLHSTNGTWVNGRRVETARLSPGDRIEIGSSVFRVEGTSGGSSQRASHVDVEIAGGLRAQDGGVAVARDAGDIHSSSARVDGAYGRAAGRDYFEGDTLEVDLTGFRTARGLARLFLIVGTLVALVGFGLFGYMILDAFGSFQEVMAESAQCDQEYELGPEWAKCHQGVGPPEIAFVPYGAAGAAVMFTGMVISIIGTMMNRNTDRREERARRRVRGGR